MDLDDDDIEEIRMAVGNRGLENMDMLNEEVIRSAGDLIEAIQKAVAVLAENGVSGNDAVNFIIGLVLSPFETHYRE